MDNKIKEYNLVLNRFFKDIGLYRTWEEYVKTNKNAKYLSTDSYIDDIFDRTRFTGYLMNVKKIYITDAIGVIFRQYVRDIFGKKYKSRHCALFKEFNSNVDFNDIEKALKYVFEK